MFHSLLFTLFTLSTALASHSKKSKHGGIEARNFDFVDLDEFDFEPRAASGIQPLRPRASAAYVYPDPGTLETTTVTDQISKDVAALIDAFNNTSLPPEVANLIDSALNSTLGKYISQTPTNQQLTNLANTINNQLTSIQSEIIGDIANGSDYTSLRNCIVTVIQQGGIQNGQNCLLDNSMTIADIQSQFEATVNQYDFLLPIQTTEQMISAVQSYLSSSGLIAPAQELVNQTLDALLSVVASTSGDYQSAILDAGDCFFESLEQDTYDPAQIYDCETRTKTVNGTYTIATTLSSLENVYRDTINQYVGFLEPNVVADIQAIGEQLLPQGDPGSPAASMQTQIDNAILSVVSSASGNEVDIGYQLLDCLNAIYTADPGDAAASAQAQNCSIGDGVVLSQQLIVDGYIQQFYGYLPPNLVQDVSSLTISSSTTSAQLQQQLNDLFTASGAGPAYVTCYEEFEACSLNALKAIEAGGSAQTCTPGAGCTSTPYDVPNASQVGGDGSNPYSAASGSIGRKRSATEKGFLAARNSIDVEAILKARRHNLEGTKMSEGRIRKRLMSDWTRRRI